MLDEPSRPVTVRVQVPPDGLHTRHYRGLPPQATGGVDTRHLYAPAALVLVRPAGEGSWFLDRYASDGSFVGNTLHASWTDTVEQLQLEYVSDLIFAPVPDDADDPRQYAQDHAARMTS